MNGPDAGLPSALGKSNLGCQRPEFVDAKFDVDSTHGLTDAHRIAHDAEHALTHAVPRLTSALVHAYPEDTRSK